MPLSLDTLLAQPSNSGTITASSGNATLPTPTTAGNTVLIVVASHSSVVTGITTPNGFVSDGGAVNPTRLYVFRRSNVPAGETSWTLTASAGSNHVFHWKAYEVVGLDPDAPVDVTVGPTATSSGTTASTGTTGSSTTYDGLVLAAHAAWNAASTTPPTFSGHTNGLVEQDEGGGTNGTGAVGLSVSMATTQQLGTFSSTATGSITFTSSNPASALLLVYSAAGAKREANIAFLWGFKVGAGAAGLATGNAGARYIETMNGSPTMTADGLQLASTSSAENIVTPGITLLSGLPAVVQRVEVRFDGSLPSVDTDLVTRIGNGGHNLVLRYVAASQKLGLKLSTSTEVLSDATVTTGVFYGVDMRLIGVGTADWKADWQIDYGSGPVAQTSITIASPTGGPLASGASATLGWTNAITVPGVTVKSYLVSVYAGHYPLGASSWTFVLLGPSGTPTVSGTVGNFAFITNNATGAALTSGTLADVPATIDEFPPTVGASADGVCAITASATDYLEVPLATYNASGTGSIRAARVVIPMWAASATTATCRLSGWDGTTATTLFAEADPGADNSSTPAWICAMWRPSGGWSQAKLDAAALRFGSNDATPDIGPLAMGMEVAIQNAETIPVFGGTGPLRVEQLSDPVSGAIRALHTFTPAGQAATLTYEVNGTPTVANGGNPIPGGSNPHIEVIEDIPDLPTVNRIELVPDG